MLYQQKIWQVSEMSWFSQKIRCVSKNFLSYQNAPFPLLSLGGERRRGEKGREGQTKWREWFRDIVYDDIKSLFVCHEQHVIVIYHNISKIHTEITIVRTRTLYIYVLTFPIHGCQWPGGLLVVSGLKRYFESVHSTKREPVSSGLEQLEPLTTNANRSVDQS